MLTALLLYWRSQSWAARGVMWIGVWLAATATAVGPFLSALAYKPDPDVALQWMALSAGCGTLAAALEARPMIATIAAIGQIPLRLVSHHVTESETELAALHLAWLGLLVGLLLRPKQSQATEAVNAEVEGSYLIVDTAAFAMATAIAAVVCLVVMRKRDGTADEWAYTYQAVVFAKGHIYAASPLCQQYLQNFYVFESSGRLFSQYTPGWPLFIAPFVLLGAPWLSGPFATGLMAVGVSRLARSAMRAVGDQEGPTPSRLVATAGSLAALLAASGTTIVISGASRYPHVYATAMYAWSLEALMMTWTPGLSAARQWGWGLVLGFAPALVLATRPAEGATLGVGIASVFIYAAARRRIGWRAFAAATAAFAGCAVMVLVILRLQLGTWFKTGYSLNSVIHPWNVVKYSMPLPNQWKYGLPLATGSYCWWPCSLPLGLAGLATLRGRSLSLVTTLALGCLGYVLYVEWLDVGQRGGFDWGYGPRYMTLLIVPMAVGGGAALAPLLDAAMQRSCGGGTALARGGPMALVVFAIVSGWLRIVPLVWPTVVDHTRRHAGLATAIADMHLQRAVVIARPGTTGFDPLDLTTNLPIDLYPDQDVIVAIDRSPEAAACLRSAFPKRTLYAATGSDPVSIVPY